MLNDVLVEFQNFTTDTFASILSEARKWKLNLVLANQFLAQLPLQLRAAILGNVGTIIAFRVGSGDAEILAKEIDIENPTALTDTPNYEAWIRLLQNGLPSSPHLIKTTLPSKAGGSLKSVTGRTHGVFARPRETVEARIAKLLEEIT